MNKIETKKLRIVNARTLIVAIDIGKLTPVGYCRCPDGRECKSFEFSNTVEGFKKLWDRVCWMKTAHHLEELVVGFESTGSYGEPLVRYLKQKPVKLVQVNPFHTKRVKELEDNSPGKTDRKDPRVIADLIELGRVLSVVVPGITSPYLFFPLRRLFMFCTLPLRLSRRRQRSWQQPAPIV